MDKHTGQILDEERIKKVRQVINLMRSSKNGKYLMSSDTFSSKDKANYTVYDTKTKEIMGRFVAQSQIMESTFDITNDGQFAVCSAYQKEGISLIRVATGEVLWTQKITKKIFDVYFDKDDKQVVVSCRYNGIYFLNIQDGQMETHKNGEKRYFNPYGKDICFPENNVAIIGKRRIQSPSFTFIDALGTPKGVLLVPAGDEYGLKFYDNDGKLLWENKDVHIGNLVYQEQNHTICGFMNMYGSEKIIIIDAENGQVISRLDIDDFACAFIENNNTLVCNTGKMYDVSNGCIKEKEEMFEFYVYYEK